MSNKKSQNIITMKQYIEKLDILLSHVCKSHGIEHAISVMNNAIEALKYIDILESDKKLVILAALLHDADDYKFFPSHTNKENLRSVMSECGHNDDEINIVVRMVDLVSTSKNGDNIPDGIPEWYVIPRYADRIESLGLIGIERCYQYNITTGTKLFDVQTPILMTNKEIIEYISKNIKRYETYNGNSASMIDHYYDKLLHISHFPIRNRFFDQKCDESREIHIEFLRYFGSCIQNKNNFTDDDIRKFIDKYST